MLACPGLPSQSIPLSCRCTQAVRSSCPLSVLWVSVKCPSSLRRHSTASTLTVRFIKVRWLTIRPTLTSTVWLLLLQHQTHLSLPAAHTDVNVELCVEVSGRRRVLRPAPVLCWCLSTLKVETIRASSSCDASNSCWTRRRCSTWWTEDRTWGERERESVFDINRVCVCVFEQLHVANIKSVFVSVCVCSRSLIRSGSWCVEETAASAGFCLRSMLWRYTNRYTHAHTHTHMHTLYFKSNWNHI